MKIMRVVGMRRDDLIVSIGQLNVFVALFAHYFCHFVDGLLAFCNLLTVRKIVVHVIFDHFPIFRHLLKKLFVYLSQYFLLVLLFNQRVEWWSLIFCVAKLNRKFILPIIHVLPFFLSYQQYFKVQWWCILSFYSCCRTYNQT